MAGDALYRITVDHRAKAVQMQLTGEIDIAVIADLWTAVESALAEGPDAIEVDFGGVTFMDSTGIRFLVGFKNRCAAIGAAWTLVNVSPSAARLIEISGLDDYLYHPD